ncbi:MAG: hypothetical protein ACK542_07865, partial [Burkholderiales bacterium]
MIQSREPQQQARAGLQSFKSWGLEAEQQADALLERAQEAQAEQTAMLDATPLESQYSAAFAAQVEAKRDQAERIEDRLENLIEQQASRLQRAQAIQTPEPPGPARCPSPHANHSPHRPTRSTPPESCDLHLQAMQPLRQLR